MASAGSASCQEVPWWSGDASTSRIEVIRCLLRKGGFLREVVEVVALNLRDSKVGFYLGRWSRFLHWSCGQSISPLKATILQIAEDFLYLKGELKLLVPALKGCLAARNHVFSLADIDFAANWVIS